MTHSGVQRRQNWQNMVNARQFGRHDAMVLDLWVATIMGR